MGASILSMSLEFPALGRHCEFVGCHVLDFLPFRCEACTHHFCVGHRTQQEHQCKAIPPPTQSTSEIQCPLCEVNLPLPKGEDANTLVNAHISRGCPPPHSTKKAPQVPAGRCAVCRAKELLPFRCDQCHKQHCAKHRFTDLHACQRSIRA